MLKKGAMLKRFDGQIDKTNEAVKIPHLHADEISACFIDGKGTAESMLDNENKYLYAEKEGKCMKDFSIYHLLLTCTTQLLI
jgi:hypothetical protein